MRQTERRDRTQAIPRGTHDGREQTHDIPKGTHDGRKQTHDIPRGTHDGRKQTHDIPKGTHDGREQTHDIPIESHDRHRTNTAPRESRPAPADRPRAHNPFCRSCNRPNATFAGALFAIPQLTIAHRRVSAEQRLQAEAPRCLFSPIGEMFYPLPRRSIWRTIKAYHVCGRKRHVWF